MLKIILKIGKLFFSSLIEIIFPYFCVGCGKKNTLLCSSCYEKIEFVSFSFGNLKEIEYVDDAIVIAKYQGVIKKLIHEFKYKSVIDVGKIIARLIYRSANIPNCDLLIPVPVHKSKRSVRGFNQSEEIVKEISKLMKIPGTNLLLKSKKTKSQMSIRNRDERKTNLENSFAINLVKLQQLQKNQAAKNLPSNLPSDLTIIIVDDVITTGSTLNECAKILKNNGVKMVVGVALAQR